MNILLFGITKDIIGSASLSVPIANASSVTIPKTVGELRQYLSTSFPGLEKLSSLAVAVNSTYADDNTTINSNDEIALIPPVSGG